MSEFGQLQVTFTHEGHPLFGESITSNPSNIQHEKCDWMLLRYYRKGDFGTCFQGT